MVQLYAELQIKRKIPLRNREVHAKKLLNELNKVWHDYENIKKTRKAVSIPDKKSGCYIEVKGAAGSDLIYKSLENITQGIRLCNIHEDQTDTETTIRATVFIPDTKRGYFIKKIKEYA